MTGSGEAEDLAAFWERARDAIGLPQSEPIPQAWSFGDSPQMADALLALVLQGTKTATAGALWEYEAEGEPLPEPGQLFIVLDGGGAAACVIETTEVQVRPMSLVDAAFAFDEGEGDRSLEWWRQAHERFFRRSLATIARDFSPEMPVVLERFALRYVAPERTASS
jgi:histidinol-phosphate aminotransferase